MKNTTEALDAITLDTWNNTDPAVRISSFMARRAFVFAEADFDSDESDASLI